MMDNKSFFRNNSENSVQIAFKLTIYDNWCMPSIAIMTTVCQHSNTNKNYTFYNLKDDNLITASLPAQDFCSVSLIPQYSNGYTPPPSSHHEPFNISLLDTQSITFETISASHSLCVICDFAPWTKDNTSCVVFIHLLETSYSSSKVAYKNSTGKGRACFPDLPTDKQYVVNITVVDGLYNQTLHSMNVSINFTSSANSLTVIIVTLVIITAVTVAVIGFKL